MVVFYFLQFEAVGVLNQLLGQLELYFWVADVQPSLIVHLLIALIANPQSTQVEYFPFISFFTLFYLWVIWLPLLHTCTSTLLMAKCVLLVCNRVLQILGQLAEVDFLWDVSIVKNRAHLDDVVPVVTDQKLLVGFAELYALLWDFDSELWKSSKGCSWVLRIVCFSTKIKRQRNILFYNGRNRFYAFEFSLVLITAFLLKGDKR